MAAGFSAISAFCERCGVVIQGFGLIKPAACPQCWKPVAYSSRKRRHDGILRCFGCYSITHISFKSCGKCGKRITAYDVSQLATPSKVVLMEKGTMTENYTVDECTDTEDFEHTIDAINGGFFNADFGTKESDRINHDHDISKDGGIVVGQETANTNYNLDDSGIVEEKVSNV